MSSRASVGRHFNIERSTLSGNGCDRRYAKLGEAFFAIGEAVERDPQWAARQMDLGFRATVFDIASSINIARSEGGSPAASAIRTALQQAAGTEVEAKLSPRLREVLRRLLSGEAEKQIACALCISRHTVHVYVKHLYRRFGVCSRPELLSLWIERSIIPTQMILGVLRPRARRSVSIRTEMAAGSSRSSR